ncbi:MAG: hypothetical protein ACYC6C_11610 [Coriobacteriia bacterium]
MPVARIDRRMRIVSGAIVVALLVGAAGVVLYARGGGPLPAWVPAWPAAGQGPLEQSGAPETLLRTVRLAGFAQASVEEASGTAILRVRVPAVDSAADVEIAWQTAVAALSVAYSSADRYVVQVFADDRGLVQVEWDGDEARSAIPEDNARALAASARFTLLTPRESEEGVDDSAGRTSASEPGVIYYILRGMSGGATRNLGSASPDSVATAQALRDAQPRHATALSGDAVSIDLEYGGAYLDAKNRAAGLMHVSGPAFEGAVVLSDDALSMRGSAPGIPALPPEVDAGQFWAGLGVETLGEWEDAGARDLVAQFERVDPGLDADDVSALRAATMTAIAVGRAPLGAVLSGVAASARAVAATGFSGGSESDAVLAAARDSRAPRSARDVTAFERDESLDAERQAESDGEFAFTWTYPGTDQPGTRHITERWRGYVRSDESRFWLADDGKTASCDASLLGWAYRIERAALVDAANVGTVRALDTGTPR